MKIFDKMLGKDDHMEQTKMNTDDISNLVADGIIENVEGVEDEDKDISTNNVE